MARFSAVLNVILASAVFVMAWGLFQQDKVSTSVSPDTDVPGFPSKIKAHGGGSIDPDRDPSNTAILERLAAIDARLMAMQQNLSHMETEDKDRPTVISPQAAAMANRRLAAMFPNAQFDPRDMSGFYAKVATLPADQRAPLVAALAQAVNSNRIKPKM